MDCVQGPCLLQYSRNPHHLRGFLEPRADRLGWHSTLHNSITVLRGRIGSDLQMTPRGSTWPMLRRTGQYPPSMVIPELGNVISVDPDEQRIGCDYIDHRKAPLVIARVYSRALSALKEYGSGAASTLSSKLLGELFGVDDGQSLFQQPQGAAQIAEILTRFYFEWSRHRDCLDQKHFEDELTKQLEPELTKQLKRDLTTAKSNSASKGAGNAFPVFERAATLLRSSLESGTHFEAAIHNLGRRSNHGGFKQIVLQGCGDVSMNFWNICYIPKEDNNGRKDSRLIHVPGEPVDDREYSCLISWDAKGSADHASEFASQLKQLSGGGQVFSAGEDKPAVSIGRVRVNQYGKTSGLRLVTGQKPLEIDAFVRYAVYGQRLAWGGNVVEPRSVAQEFSDVRHLLDLPSLNPPPDKDEADESNKAEADEAWQAGRKAAENAGLGDLFQWKECPQVFRQQPRYMFNVPTEHEVRLGERALLPPDPLLQAACDHPVEIELSQLGAPWDWVTVCLVRSGYTLKRSRDEAIQRGDFTWDRIDPAKPKLVVFFRKALYPCTLVGIGKLGGAGDQKTCGDLFLLAWGHDFDQDQGYTIFDCAKLLVDLGAQAVLLIDEGRDVFQHVFANFTELKRYEELDEREQKNGAESCPAHALRGQMRATLAFWVE